MSGKRYLAEFLAELLGTFCLVLMGDGAIAQVVLGNRMNAGKGDFLNIAIGYGLALMIGILVSGGVSGGHLNPAVTLSMAALKKIKLIQIPIYFLAQYLGAFLAALVLWGNIADALLVTECGGGVSFADCNYTMSTAGIFASYPVNSEISAASLAMDQILGTAMLVLIILAVTDPRNMGINSSLVPLLIGLGLTAIHLSLGLNSGSAINPARDLSPRLLTLMVGWGADTFKSFDYFFWIPWILPHIGGLIGAGVYQFGVAMHHEKLDDF